LPVNCTGLGPSSVRSYVSVGLLTCGGDYKSGEDGRGRGIGVEERVR